jgi:DNA-binding response OmpR family regulator
LGLGAPSARRLTTEYASPKLTGDEVNMRVLIVDDDELLLDACAVALSERGHETRLTNGVGALKALKAETWDVVLVDILMPDVDGLEVIGAAKQVAHPPRILAMSGGGRITASDCIMLAKGFGAEASFMKPLDFLAVARSIEAPSR